MSHTELLIFGYNYQQYEKINHRAVPLLIKFTCCHFYGYKACCIAAQMKQNQKIGLRLIHYHDYHLHFTQYPIDYWMENELHIPKCEQQEYTKALFEHKITTVGGIRDRSTLLDIGISAEAVDSMWCNIQKLEKEDTKIHVCSEVEDWMKRIPNLPECAQTSYIQAFRNLDINTLDALKIWCIDIYSLCDIGIHAKHAKLMWANMKQVDDSNNIVNNKHNYPTIYISDDLLKQNPLKVLNKKIENPNNFTTTQGLYCALMENHESCFGELLPTSVQIPLPMLNKDAAIILACKQGKAKCIPYLLERDPGCVNEQIPNGRTPLWFACIYGYFDIVEMLIDHSKRMSKQNVPCGILDINQTDSRGYSALFVAAQNGHVEVVRLLLQNEVDVNKPESRGHHTPLWISALRGHTEVVKLLIQQPDIKIDYQDKSGVTALWAACQNGNSQVVECLLKNQKSPANPNEAKHDGCTPVWIAASRGNVSSLAALIDAGANVDQPAAKDGSTPLFIASQKGNIKAVELLVAANAEIDGKRTTDGTTPIIMAAHNGHLHIVRKLMNHGADIIGTNSLGLNILSCAAMAGKTDVVKLVYESLTDGTLDKGTVDNFVNSVDSENGWTAYHLACMTGHDDVIKYLIDTVGIDILKKDYENKTGLDHAKQNGHQNIVSWLSKLEDQYINSYMNIK